MGRGIALGFGALLGASAFGAAGFSALGASSAFAGFSALGLSPAGFAGAPPGFGAPAPGLGAAAGLSFAGALAGADDATPSSISFFFSRRATGGATDDAGLLTNSPISLSFSSATLLSTPSSDAIS